MPKINSSKDKSSLKHDPLAIQLEQDKYASSKKSSKKPSKNSHNDGNEQSVDSKLSAKLLKLAQEQQKELKVENGDISEQSLRDFDLFKSGESRENDSNSSEDEEDKEFARDTDYNPNAGNDFDFYGEDLEIDESDAALIERYLKPSSNGTNLASLVMSKIEESNATEAPLETNSRSLPNANPKLVEVYTRVGMLLSRFKSGKLPKAFKIIPSLPNWEDILYITKPEAWTPNAMFMATRLFCSNLKPKAAQKFYQYVLLDAVRHDIKTNNKLNYHHYMALKRAIYKPAAFFKGIILPLCQSGTCTLKEAALISSVMTKVSIPMLHTAATLLKLAELEYSGANSLFIRILLDKKYALPYKVIDALVFHFLRFANDRKQLPVLWHQSLLVFVQRYKEDLVPEQKDALFGLIKCQFHFDISPEIRRELELSVCRGEINQMEMIFE